MDRLTVPHHSPNDPRAVIVAWLVEDGAEVSANQVIASLESTKAIFEIETESSGFLRQVAPVGKEVESGDLIGFVTTTRDEDLPGDIIEPDQDESELAGTQPKEGNTRKVTARAKITADRLGIDLSDIPKSGRISQSDVEEYAAATGARKKAAELAERASTFNADYPTESSQGNVTRLLVIGGGNGAKLVLDVVSRDHSSGLQPVGILDDDESKHGTNIMGVTVLGSIDSAQDLWDSGNYDSAVICISSNNQLRAKVHGELTSHGVPFANVIDPTAVISPSAEIGTGNVILGHCRIGPFATVGDDNFFSAMSNIEHDCVVGSHTSFGPGVAFSGEVKVGNGVKFGTNIGCEPGVTIGDWSVIASGMIVNHSIPAHSVLKATSVGKVRSTDG